MGDFQWHGRCTPHSERVTSAKGCPAGRAVAMVFNFFHAQSGLQRWRALGRNPGLLAGWLQGVPSGPHIPRESERPVNQGQQTSHGPSEKESSQRNELPLDSRMARARPHRCARAPRAPEAHPAAVRGSSDSKPGRAAPPPGTRACPPAVEKSTKEPRIFRHTICTFKRQ